MLKIEFDVSDWKRQAESIEGAAEQLPFAMALALNRAADVTRQFLIQSTWPQHVQQRNKSFITASLTTKDSRASKQSLAVEIYDKLNRGNLQAHAKGGQRVPRGGSNLAVPSSNNVSRTASGVPKNLLPKNIPPSQLFKRQDVLYAKSKRGNKLKLLYVLKTSTKVPMAVPFYQDFATSMARELHRTMPMAMARAMATRR